MPTVVTHAISAAALTSAFPASSVPRRLMILGAICAMTPDVDVFGFRFGIPYGALWGHRGLTHSLAFAFCLSILAWFVAMPYVVGLVHRAVLWLYLFLASASHGVLDAFTNGGLGVAFFSPFDATRYFFPCHPIEVSPIGAAFSPSEAYPCCKANSSGFGSLRSFLLFWRLRFDACLNARQV